MEQILNHEMTEEEAILAYTNSPYFKKELSDLLNNPGSISNINNKIKSLLTEDMVYGSAAGAFAILGTLFVEAKKNTELGNILRAHAWPISLASVMTKRKIAYGYKTNLAESKRILDGLISTKIEIYDEWEKYTKEEKKNIRDADKEDHKYYDDFLLFHQGEQQVIDLENKYNEAERAFEEGMIVFLSKAALTIASHFTAGTKLGMVFSTLNIIVSVGYPVFDKIRYKLTNIEELNKALIKELTIGIDKNANFIADELDKKLKQVLLDFGLAERDYRNDGAIYFTNINIANEISHLKEKFQSIAEEFNQIIREEIKNLHELNGGAYTDYTYNELLEMKEQVLGHLSYDVIKRDTDGIDWIYFMEGSLLNGLIKALNETEKAIFEIVKKEKPKELQDLINETVETAEYRLESLVKDFIHNQLYKNELAELEGLGSGFYDNSQLDASPIWQDSCHC